MHPMLIKAVGFVIDVIQLVYWRTSAAVNAVNAFNRLVQILTVHWCFSVAETQISKQL